MASTAPTSFTDLSSSQRDQFFSAITEALTQASGMGSRYYLTETLLTEHDRFGTAPVAINPEMVGLTFFTRPKLNFSTTSLRQDPRLSMMDTMNPMDLMFAQRCTLDTNFARSQGATKAVGASPWINRLNPFNIAMSNLLIGMQGWPDFSVESKTSTAGQFGEDMTMARGSDRGRRTYEIQCTFRDMTGGYMMAQLFMWLHAMALQMEGAIVPYPEDRDANRLNYTVSIYRFVMSPDMRTIVKWAKGTGCYPGNLPIGEVFNFGPGDSVIHTSQQFTVPFTVNHVSYMDPRDLQAFNTLVTRYAGKSTLDSRKRQTGIVANQPNFAGLPYIDLYSGTNELMWLAEAQQLVNPLDALVAQMKAISTAPNQELIKRYTTTASSNQ